MTKNRNLKGLNKVLLSLTGMIVILTTIYWIYYQFITGKVISNSHWHFREFLFWNYIRELSIFDELKEFSFVDLGLFIFWYLFI